MAADSEEIADEFFGKEEVTSVDFEITFAALLSTMVLTFPVEHHILFGQVIAFSLLLLTLIRRMAITSPFSPKERILGQTTPLISFVSTSAIIYLIVALPSLTQWVPVSSSVASFSIFAVIALSITVIAQELLFRDYLAWWYVKFTQKKEQRDLLDGVWKDMAAVSYWASMARRNRETYRELGNRLNTGRPDLSNYEFPPGEVLRTILAVSLLLTFIYSLPFLYSAYVFGPPGLLLIFAVVAIHDQSAFWYIAYGNPSYEDLRQHVVTIIIRTGLYVTVVAVLYSQLKIPQMTVPL